MIVENRQGADGIPAVVSFLGARDNHTLMFSFAGLITINPLTHDKLPYDPARDLVPIASAVDNFFGVAASETLKVASLEDFIKLVRAQPGHVHPGEPGRQFRVGQHPLVEQVDRGPERRRVPDLVEQPTHGTSRAQATQPTAPATVE